MAGIYLHIPFCKQACHYCDFHFSTQTKAKPDLLEALEGEMILQRDYLEDDSIATVYLGGGTPSMLSAEEIERLLSTIKAHYPLQPNAEITLEANPDDLNLSSLQAFRKVGVNRLSIGIQSFQDEVLQYLNRAHEGQEAEDSLLMAREAGFDNISIDLIYGIPDRDDDLWKADLDKALALQPEHISAYCLTIEEKTVFGNWLKKGKISSVEEEFAARQFEILLQHLGEAGYEQYEISNFCLPERYSRHNSNYWKQEKYLGLGPSAHSYNGQSRQYNIANNHQYIRAIQEGQVPYELDALERSDHINEYILTTLRTIWGTDFHFIQQKWQADLYADQQAYIDDIVEKGLAYFKAHHLILTDRGKLLADQIASDLFYLNS